MASEYGTPVLFAKEKNIWILSARVVFDTNGAAVLDTTQSKGFCAVWQNTPTFNAGTTQSTSTIGTVSSFKGLFSGMNLTTSSGGAFGVTETLGSISASAGTFNLVTQAGSTGFPNFSIPSVTFVAGSAGGGTGQYILQLGQQAGARLSTYNKLLMLQHSFDETSGSASGSATVQQLAPLAPSMVLIQNNTTLRTVPPTAATNSTDASITVQFGTGTGKNFVATAPAAGEAVRIVMIMGNSSAP